MKLLSIFIRNLKTVARNWKYFAVLFLLPLFLIIVSAVMLSSNSPNNIRIGLIESDDLTDSSRDIAYGDFLNVGKIKLYSDWGSCREDLINYRISVCLNAEVYPLANQTNLIVSIDNSRQIIDFYIRKTILEQFFEEQSAAMDYTRSELNSKFGEYSVFIRDALVQINQSEHELRVQEEMLVSYQNELRDFRLVFDEFYSVVYTLKSGIDSSRVEFAHISSDFKLISSKLAELRSEMNSLQTTLSSEELPSFNNLFVLLNDIEESVSAVEESVSSSSLDEVYRRIESLYSQLDGFRMKLDTLDSDLSRSIGQAHSSAALLREYREKLLSVEGEFQSYQTVGGQTVSVSFQPMRDFSDDLVLMSFPFVVSIIVVFSSLVLSNKFVLNNVHKPSHVRELLTPTRGFSFVAADYLANLFFVFIQVVVLMIFGMFFFQLPFSILPSILLGLFLASSILIFIGMALGYFIRSESVSVLVTVFSLMFLFLCSDLLVPSVLSGTVVRFLINLNPFVVINNYLFNILLLGQSLSENLFFIGRLVIYFISSFFVALVSYAASKDDVFR